MKKKIIVTGFEPFLAHESNPSQWLVHQLKDSPIEDTEISCIVLPVAFDRAAELLIDLIKRDDPIAICMFGLAANRHQVTPERVAINVMDGEKDNDGMRKHDEPIILNGPDAYFSTLPVRKLVDACQEVSTPASISNTAGTYVCNALMYQVLHYLCQSRKSIPAGFIHIPFIDESAKISPQKLLHATKQMLKEVVVSVQMTSDSR